MCLFETGQVDAARRLVRRTAPAVQATVDALGDASAVAVTFLITIDGRLAYRDGQPETARRLLAGLQSWRVSPDIRVSRSTS